MLWASCTFDRPRHSAARWIGSCYVSCRLPITSFPSTYTNSGLAVLCKKPMFSSFETICWLSWLGYRIHQLHLCRVWLPTHPNKCPGYDTKQSDGEAPVMLELRRMWSTPSLPSLSGPLWPGVVAPNRVLSMGQIELNCTYAKLNCLK